MKIHSFVYVSHKIHEFSVGGRERPCGPSRTNGTFHFIFKLQPLCVWASVLLASGLSGKRCSGNGLWGEDRLGPGPLLDSQEPSEKHAASPTGRISTSVLLWGWRAPSLEAARVCPARVSVKSPPSPSLEADLSVRPWNCNVSCHSGSLTLCPSLFCRVGLGRCCFCSQVRKHCCNLKMKSMKGLGRFHLGRTVITEDVPGASSCEGCKELRVR